MKQRVVTAVLLIVPVLAALFAQSSLPLLGLAFAVLTVGQGEISRLVAGNNPSPASTPEGSNPRSPGSADPGLRGADNSTPEGSHRPAAQPHSPSARVPAALLGAAAIGSSWELQRIGTPHERSGAAIFMAVWTGFGILSTWLCCRPNGKPFFGNFASFWLSGPLAALLVTHSSPPGPGLLYFATPTLLALVPLWAGDTAAIFAGMAFGRHPMAPTISPKKTWEGGFANLLACIAVAILLAIWIGKTWQIGLACGLAAGTLGQAGDLFESYVKRQAGVKDSGTLLPGHGGLMDRIDSLLFTAPAVALILTFA